MPVEKKAGNEYYQESDFLDFVIVLLKHKMIILSFFVAAVIFSGLFIFSQNQKIKPLQVFYSECVFEPYSSPPAKAKILLSTNIARAVSEKMKGDESFLKAVNYKLVDEKNTWLASPPDLKTTVDNLVANLDIRIDGNMMTLIIASGNQEVSRKTRQEFILAMSNFFRQQDLPTIESQLALCKEKLAETKDAHLKSTFSLEYLNLSFKQDKLKKDGIYGLNVISDQTDFSRITSAGKTYSKNVIVFILILSLVMGVLVALLVQYIQNLKKLEPEKFSQMKRHLSFRRKAH